MSTFNIFENAPIKTKKSADIRERLQISKSIIYDNDKNYVENIKKIREMNYLEKIVKS